MKVKNDFPAIHLLPLVYNHLNFKATWIIFLIFIFWNTNVRGQNVIIKDTDDNVLMQVNDEGKAGSISIKEELGPGITLDKLYNVDGDLFWSGLKLGTENEGGGWMLSGMDLFPLENSYNVGIGTTNALGKLHVIQESTISAFRVDDQAVDPSPFIIDDTGNVGIGTISPTEKVHVLGDVLLEDSSSPLLKFYLDDSYDAFLGILGSDLVLNHRRLGPLKFRTYNSDRMIIDESGNVGIGNINPGFPLDVTKNTTVNNINPVATFRSVGANSSGSIRLENSLGNYWVIGAMQDPDHSLSFNYNSNNLIAGNTFKITPDGKIGIGTANPLSRIHVAGTARIDSPSPLLTFYESNTIKGYVGLSFDAMYLHNSLSSGIYFGTDDQSRMVLDYVGNLGIGTLTPSAKTHIVQEGSSDALRIDDGPSDSSPFVIDASGNVGIGMEGASAKMHIVQTNAASAFRIDDELSDVSPFIVNASGMVGIGTESPSTALELTRGKYNINMAETKFDYFAGETDSIALAVYNSNIYTYLADHFKEENMLGTKNEYYGIRTHSSSGNINYGIYASASGGSANYAGYFEGDVEITGALSKGSGSFKIDHPLDPENKYLYHSFVESPDMLNIYNGNAITGSNGYATVELPPYFEALNMDFRYQLTVIGEFSQAIISKKISNNEFEIRTDKPHIEVSWQVTGIRHDAYARKNRIQTEEDKNPEDRGSYLHPEAFDKPKTLKEGYQEL